MTAFFHRSFCCSALLILSLLPGVKQASAAIAPDVTSLTSIAAALSTPVRLASDSAGSLYVSDPRGGGIVKFASNGSHTATYSTAAGILGLAIASNGEILVSQGTSVAVYTAAGVNKQTPFGTFGKANGIAVTSSGKIFVVDSLNNEVQIFNADYTGAGKFGGSGTTAGKFLQPTGVSYEKVSDQIAVTDTRNGRIQFFSTAGVHQKTIGSFGAGPLKFTSPQSVSFEYSADQSTLKRIYVVDSFQSTIQVIDGTTFEFIRYIGAYGVTDGKLVTPSDILFDKNNRLVVANGTGKLSLFGVADPTTGPYLQIDTVPQATNQATLVVTGTTTGTSVTVNGVSATITGSSWSATVPLTPGVNAITIITTDANGLTTTKVSSVTAIAPSANPVSVTVAPVVTVTSQPILALRGTVTTGSAITINGVAATVAGNDWSANVPLSNGSNSIKVSASKAGMDTSTIDLSVTLDTSFPTIATHLPSTGSIFSTPLQTISGTASSASTTTIVLTVNGITQAVPVSGGVFSLPVVLVPGSNTISVAAVDSYGATTQLPTTTVSYDPQAPRVTIITPAAAVSGIATYHLEGTAPAGSSVTVNGSTIATVSGTNWSADVQLVPGVNSFEVKATPTTGNPTTAVTTVSYSPGLPSLAIVSPTKDTPVGSATNTISGTASPGSAVTALVNGEPTPVTTSASGSFSVAVPTMTVPGTYTVIVNVTNTATGATSTSTRSIIYDPIPPVITTMSATSPVKVTAPGGVLIAKDKNGPVGTVTTSGGIATLDLTGATFDTATLNIQALSPAGLSSRNGDLNLDGVVDIKDALKALKVLVGLEPQPTFEQMLRGDVGPVTNGEPSADNRIRMSDIVVIMEKIIGQSSW